MRYAHIKGEFNGGDSLPHRIFFSFVQRNNGHVRHIHDETHILDPARRDGVAYPLGFYAVLYRLGITDTFLQKWGGYIPTFFDCGLLIVLYTAMKVLGGTQYYWLLLVPFQQIFSVHRGRSFYFNERSFGTLMSTLYILGMCGWALQGMQWYWVVCSVIGFYFFAISSKFSYQATVLIALITTVITQDLFFIGHWIAHYMFILVLTGGYTWEVCKNSMQYLQFYRWHYASIAGHTQRTLWHDVWKLPYTLLRLKYREAKLLWFHSSLWQIISAFPLSLLLCEALIRGNDSVMMHMWIATLLIVCVVSLRWFRFIGAAERYIEYALLPALVILSFEPISAFYIPTLVLCGLMTITSYVYFYRWWFTLYSAEILQKIQDEQDVTLFLQQEGQRWKGRKVLLPTFPRFPHMLQLSTDSYQCVSYLTGVDPRDSESIRELMPETIYTIADRLAYFVDKYAVSYIVIDKIMQRRIEAQRRTTYYRDPPGENVYENTSYLVQKITQ